MHGGCHRLLAWKRSLGGRTCRVPRKQRNVNYRQQVSYRGSPVRVAEISESDYEHYWGQRGHLAADQRALPGLRDTGSVQPRGQQPHWEHILKKLRGPQGSLVVVGGVGGVPRDLSEQRAGVRCRTPARGAWAAGAAGGAFSWQRAWSLRTSWWVKRTKKPRGM